MGNPARARMVVPGPACRVVDLKTHGAAEALAGDLSGIRKCLSFHRDECRIDGQAPGTAGWTRTTGLLIHSPSQLVDFTRICSKFKQRNAQVRRCLRLRT